MYPLVTNPEIEVSPNSYQYRVIAVVTDDKLNYKSKHRVPSGSGFTRWGFNEYPSSMTSTTSTASPLIPVSARKYKLTSEGRAGAMVENKIFMILSGKAKNLPESRWKQIWEELVKDPDIQATQAFAYFDTNKMIHPRPWYLKYGYAGLGGAALGALVVGYGLVQLLKPRK